MKERSATFNASAIVLGLASVAGFSGAVHAQGGAPGGAPGGGAPTSSVQLYGSIDLGVGKLESQAPGAPRAPITSVNGVHNSGLANFFGFRGTESLGGTLRAQFQLESFFRADTGQSGRFSPPSPPIQDPFFSRSAWVGLAGDFGDVKLGNVANPAFQSMVFTSAMSGVSTFSPAFRQQYNGSTRGYMALDTALPNALSYTTPRFGGVSGSVVVQAAEERGSSNVIANAVYRSGPVVLTAAFADVSHLPPPDPAGAVDEEVVVVGGSYDFKAVKLFAQYTNHKEGTTGATTKTPHLGLTVPVGTGELQAAWARGKTETGNASSTRTTIGLGYLHPLSRRTSLYGYAGSDKVSVGTATSYLVGIRHAF
ncbi:MAG: porin [Hydrogenophaga sp.]|jgi:predicted porin|nr:porin [Hydrogenophaga sp.]